MQNTSVYAYSSLLSLATVIIAVAGALWVIRKEPGQRIFFRDLAIVFAIAFYIPGAIFYFKRDLSLWWLAIPVSFLGYAFKNLFAAFTWKSVPLVRFDLATTRQPDTQGLKLVHLSDLHLTSSPTTLEGGLERQLVIDATRKSLKWAAEHSPDLIAITGDITDTGAPAEWEIFASLLGELPPECRSRVVFVPGNHDLVIQQRHYGADNDGKALLDYDLRCLAFVRSYFSLLPRDAKMILVRRQPPAFDEIEVQVLHSAVESAVNTYMKFPPRPQNAGEMLHGLKDGFAHALAEREDTIGWRRDLSDYVPGIVISDELRAKFTPNGFWPNEKYPLIQDLLHRLYPLILFENDRVVVLALNSNTVPSTWLADGALGRIGNAQLILMAAALEKRPKDKVVVVLVHHHIGCPHDVQFLVARTMLELKALQLHEGPELADILRRHGAPTFVLHGHKHIAYSAKADGITVLSAASVAYGDKLGGANCNALLIGDRGDVSLFASANIK